ncbi:hypothetical protein Barb6XT_03042 [Bacteroidales bacterium Barb6XT]|nr:hypothetical protein Barb6XT_03042 [Bacteroidales bacterium Barb6XT]
MHRPNNNPRSSFARARSYGGLWFREYIPKGILPPLSPCRRSPFQFLSCGRVAFRYPLGSQTVVTICYRPGLYASCCNAWAYFNPETATRCVRPAHEQKLILTVMRPVLSYVSRYC